jgi:hypothetical protein
MPKDTFSNDSTDQLESGMLIEDDLDGQVKKKRVPRGLGKYKKAFFIITGVLLILAFGVSIGITVSQLVMQSNNRATAETKIPTVC